MLFLFFFFFFFNDTATTEIYTLSLHDALPISEGPARYWRRPIRRSGSQWRRTPVHIARSTVGLGQSAAVGPQARTGLRGYGTYSGGSPARAGEGDLGSCVAAGGPCSWVPESGCEPTGLADFGG